LIRDFPIPNSREDLLSLIHFIHPKIQNNLKPDPNAEDWKVKFKEVMALAKNAYKGDSKTRVEFEELERSLNTTVSGDLKTSARRQPHRCHRHRRGCHRGHCGSGEHPNGQALARPMH